MVSTVVNESPRNAKKGELIITIITARNLRSDGKADSTYCIMSLGEQTAKTTVVKDRRDPVWNETFSLDLISLDNSELLISVFGKRRLSSDKFLGQIQIPVRALSIPKEEMLYYLTDRPSPPNPADTPGKRKASGTIRKKSNKSDDEDKAIITGEIAIKLDFVHRLLRGKSRVSLLPRDSSDSIKVEATFSLSPSMSGSLSAASSSTSISRSMSIPVRDGGITPKTPSPKSSPQSSPRVVSPPMRSPRSKSPPASPRSELPKEAEVPKRTLSPKPSERSISPGPSKALTPRNAKVPDAELSVDEAIIIDHALQEKLKLVKKKLEEKRELIRIVTAKINGQEDGAQNEAERLKLRDMQNELRELEKLEKEMGDDSQKKEAAKLTPREPVARTSSKLTANGREVSFGKRQSMRVDGGRRLTIGMQPLPKLDASLGDYERFESSNDEIRFLRMRIKALEMELEAEKKLTEMANSKILLLEKENKRAEADVQRLEGELKSSRDTNANVAVHPSRWASSEMPMDERLDAVQKIHQEIHLVTKESKESLEVRRKEVEEKLKEVELDIEENVLKQKQMEVELMERRLLKRQGLLTKMEDKSKKAQEKLEFGEDEEGELDSGDSEDSADYDASADSSETTNKRPKSVKIGEVPDEKFDMLVGKLEKLDKLDELLRKIDALKFVSVGDGGGGGGSSSGRSHSELKQELEELQKIIFDETGTHSEKEKEDANIKYEKTFGELSQTSEYKMEQAQALDEKRKMNEPLNKEALEKMLKVFTPENIKNDPTVKEKLSKNPELVLIGMDPKAILAKHQNDFAQYLLRITEIDELRAIRASLPKFRNDQKRQLEWVETLEAKIEQVSKAPPKKPPPPKPASAKLWKPKAPPKGGAPPTDMFAELLAKRNKLGTDGTPEEQKPEPEKKEPSAPSKIKLAPLKPSASVAPVTPPPGAPPPPPPPPSLQF